MTPRDSRASAVAPWSTRAGTFTQVEATKPYQEHKADGEENAEDNEACFGGVII